MNRKTVGIILLVGIGLAALLSLSRAPVSFIDLLKQPLQSLWGSHQQLQTGILEVSENIDTVQDATRQLFQPLGVLRLNRRFPGSNPSEKPTPSSLPPSNDSSPRKNP